MQLKFWTLFFLIVSSQGLLIGLLLLGRSKYWNAISIHLSILMLSFAATLGLWVCFWNDWNYAILNLNFSYNAIPLLYGPALYLHLKTVHGNKSRALFLHYLPALLVFAYFLPFYFMESASKITYLQANAASPNWVIAYSGHLHMLSMIAYIILVYSVEITDPRKTRWTHILRGSFVAFVAAYLLNSHVLYYLVPVFTADVLSAIVMSASIYIIGFMAFNRLSLFRQLDLSNPNKYRHSSLTQRHAEVIVQKMSSFLRQEKAYKSAEMTLAELARTIEIPPHYISESLNKYNGVNFSDFINRLRVEEAKKLLLSPDTENLKMESIGYAVGFNSKTTFYNAFKKETGHSPAAYKKEV